MTRPAFRVQVASDPEGVRFICSADSGDLLPLPPADQAALRTAFRLALLDAVPVGQDLDVRLAALKAARDRLAAYLLQDRESQDMATVLRGVRERAVLATALEVGYQEALAIVRTLPPC